MLNVKLNVYEEIPSSVSYLPRKFSLRKGQAMFIDSSRVAAAKVFPGWKADSEELGFFVELHFGSEPPIVAEFDDHLADMIGVSNQQMRSFLDSLDEIKDDLK
jgi:hypothetical protein